MVCGAEGPRARLPALRGPRRTCVHPSVCLSARRARPTIGFSPFQTTTVTDSFPTGEGESFRRGHGGSESPSRVRECDCGGMKGAGGVEKGRVRGCMWHHYWVKGGWGGVHSCQLQGFQPPRSYQGENESNYLF